eukprot:231339-Prorocentrum_minimum.AAC.1
MQGNHELRTPRWDVERQNVLTAGSTIRWEDKVDLAAFTGANRTGLYHNYVIKSRDKHSQTL